VSESERLQELRRQREQVAEHLAWLDGEIARSAPPARPAGSRASAPRPTSPPPPISADADELLRRYADTPPGEPPISRSGCIIAFTIAMVLLIAAVGLVYGLFYR